ncbi:hypothetical protein Patl1_20100 [Pistacia atlantica]|uniref:Uncharacterized protein n=1 Tax=Pistacia atlantica TaxID=434234 RepID=A0ACC1BMD9_9ROSI|nr:hypothetical protein Patl1_20100 [Pistacia atlantica]
MFTTVLGNGRMFSSSVEANCLCFSMFVLCDGLDQNFFFFQPGLRPIWEKYYEEAHAVVYVIDAACTSRFEDSKSALEKVLRHEDLQGAPLLILANKQDLPDAVSAEELARYLDLKKLDERVYMFEAVSGYDGMGIKESLEWLIEVMERSKRTEMLRARAGAAPASA